MYRSDRDFGTGMESVELCSCDGLADTLRGLGLLIADEKFVSERRRRSNRLLIVVGLTGGYWRSRYHESDPFSKNIELDICPFYATAIQSGMVSNNVRVTIGMRIN
jgi:hypothetical protein